MKFTRMALLAAFAMAPAAASAQSPQDLIDGMTKCSAIAVGPERLACYDALSAELRAKPPEPMPPPSAAPGTPPPPAATADSRPWYSVDRIFGVAPRDQVKPEQFGSENIAPPTPPPGQENNTAYAAPPTPIDSISAGVTEYSYTPYGKFLVVLDNGQVWRQLDSDDGSAHFMKGQKNSVTISRGALESYNMVINDASANFKVKRLR